ncbi:MAG TPA: PDZ domain-containing protein [Bdellovibrionota bacterium]|jgi:type II secretion system protein C|nr:PDZ domain-containing protein [Bdellovibrionota bacterium]
MKRKFRFPEIRLKKFTREDLARFASRQWERFRLALAKTPSFKSMLMRVPTAKPWILLVMGLLTADLVVQTLLSTVLLDNSRPSVGSVRGRRVPVLKPRTTYNAITTRNMFCPGCPVPDTKALVLNRPKDCGKAERMPSGPKLLGTIVLSDPKYSVATISSGSDSKAIKKGETVPGSGKVFEIRRRRVCFESEIGTLRYIEMPEERGIQLGQPLPSAMPSSPTEEIATSSTGEIEIKREFLVSKLSDPSVLTSAASTPIYENGQLVGFKVLSIKPGSVFEQLIQVGDEIRGINGEPITSIPQIQKLFSGIRNVKELNITINRDGRTFQQAYKVGE